MPDDRLRWLKLLVAAGLLIGLGARYAWLAESTPIGWRLYTADPATYDGADLLLPLYTVVAIEGPDRYLLTKIVRRIPVEGDTTDLRVDQVVSVRATFRAEDLTAVEVARDLHRLRDAKKLLGLLGLALCLAGAPWAFRLGADGYLHVRSQGRSQGRSGDG